MMYQQPPNKKTSDRYVADYLMVDPFCDNLGALLHDDYDFTFLGRDFRVFINVGDTYHCNIHGLTNPSNAEGFNTKCLSGAIAMAVKKFRTRCKTHIVQKLRLRQVDFANYPVFVNMPPSKLRRSLFPNEVPARHVPTIAEKTKQLFLLRHKNLEDRIKAVKHVADTIDFKEGAIFTFLGNTYEVDVSFNEDSKRHQVVVFNHGNKKFHYTHNGPLDRVLLCAKKEWVHRRLFDTNRRIKIRNRLERELGSM